jgi:uncharacterized protein YbjT (DUF2867 family)
MTTGAGLDVLVVGATGQQGGALADELLSHGHRVRALTRTPDSPGAARLLAAGARVVGGDLTEPGSLAEAARGADAAFLMSGVGDEARFGQAAVDALAGAGIGHLVYASVASADRHTGIPHFDAKAVVEQRVRALPLPWTIVAPVFFMDNPRPSLAESGGRVLASPLAPTTVLQQVAVADIGAFLRYTMEHSAELSGARVEIAGDALTGPAAAAVLTEVTGRAVRYVPVEADPRRFGADLAAMFRWLDRVGYQVDIAGVRREFADVGWQTFAQWAGKQNWPPS